MLTCKNIHDLSNIVATKNPLHKSSLSHDGKLQRAQIDKNQTNYCDSVDVNSSWQCVDTQMNRCMSPRGNVILRKNRFKKNSVLLKLKIIHSNNQGSRSKSASTFYLCGASSGYQDSA